MREREELRLLCRYRDGLYFDYAVIKVPPEEGKRNCSSESNVVEQFVLDMKSTCLISLNQYYLFNPTYNLGLNCRNLKKYDYRYHTQGFIDKPQ